MIPIKSSAYIYKAKKTGLIESMVLQEKMTWTEIIAKTIVPPLQLNSKALNKPNVKKTAKLIKKNIEELWEETCVER